MTTDCVKHCMTWEFGGIR